MRFILLKLFLKCYFFKYVKIETRSERVESGCSDSHKYVKCLLGNTELASQDELQPKLKVHPNIMTVEEDIHSSAKQR